LWKGWIWKAKYDSRLISAVQQIWAWIRTGPGLKPIFGRTRTESDCNFFEKWLIRTESDSENFCCFNVIILKISKILFVIRFHRFAKWLFVYVLPSNAKTLLGLFCNSNCIHLCSLITFRSSSNVNRFFFKENVRNSVWMCRDLISLILGTRFFSDFRDPMIIFSDSRDPIWNSRDVSRVPETP